MTIRDIIIAFGFEVDKNSEKKAEKSISSLKSMANKALGAIGIGFSIVKVNALVEEFKGVNQQIKAASSGMGDQKKAQEQILAAAQNSRQSYKEMAATITGLMNTHSKLFKSVKDTSAFAELTNKAFKAAGANESSIASMNSAITSAFTTGKLSAGGFQTLMKECPETIKYLSETLSISKQHVKALGTAGAITSNQIYTAFTANSKTINASYSEVKMTVTDALKHIRDGFAAWLTQMDDTLQITQTISKTLLRTYNAVMNVLKKVTSYTERLANRLGGTNNLLKLIAMTIGSIMIVANGKKIVSFLDGLKKILGAVNIKVVIIAAAVLAVMLLVQDFIQFMKGNKSVFGSLLKKMGVDADEVREKIKSAIEKIKAVALDLWNKIKPILSKIVAMVKNLIEKILPPLLKIIKVVAEAIMSVIEAVLPILIDLMGEVISIIDTLFECLAPIIDLLGELLGVLLNLIADILKPILQLITALLKPLLELLSSVLKPILGLVNDLIAPLLSVLNDALKPIIPVIKVLAELLGKYLSMAIANITAVLKPLIEVLKVVFVTAINNIIVVVKTVIGFFKRSFENVKKIFGGIIDFVAGIFTGNWKRAWEGIKNIFIGIWNQIKNVFSTVWNFFKDIGANIIEGLKAGLKAAWDGLKSAVTSIFDNVVKWFKDLFGIHSPSTVFKDFGSMMMQGLINGLKGMMSAVSDVVSNIGEKVKSGFSNIWEGAKNVAGKIGNAVSTAKDAVGGAIKNGWDSFTGWLGFSNASTPQQAASTIAKETNNRTITQNVNIVNQFNGGSKEQQKDGAKAMKKSSQDATGYMARGLAYSR